MKLLLKIKNKLFFLRKVATQCLESCRPFGRWSALLDVFYPFILHLLSCLFDSSTRGNSFSLQYWRNWSLKMISSSSNKLSRFKPSCQSNFTTKQKKCDVIIKQLSFIADYLILQKNNLYLEKKLPFFCDFLSGICSE